MAKNIIKLFGIVAGLGMASLASCSKDDAIAPAIERLNEHIRATQEALVSAPNGWMLRMYPDDDLAWGGYTLFLKFSEDGTVRVMSELGKDGQIDESQYMISGTDGAVLSFVTYNESLHLFSEPEPKQFPFSQAPPRVGANGDFIFRIRTVSKDKVEIEGLRSKVRMELLPVAETLDWSAAQSAQKASVKVNYAPSFTISYNGKSYKGEMNDQLRYLSWRDADSVEHKTPFAFTEDGIELYRADSVDGHSFKTFTRDRSSSKIRLTSSDGQVALDGLVAVKKAFSELFFAVSEDYMSAGNAEYYRRAKSILSRTKINNLDWEYLGVIFTSAGLDRPEEYGIGAVMLVGKRFPSRTSFPIRMVHFDEEAMELSMIYDPARLSGDLMTQMVEAKQHLIAAPFVNLGRVELAGGRVVVDNDVTQPRAFKIETDDIYNPKWFKLIEKDNPANWVYLVIDTKALPNPL